MKLFIILGNQLFPLKYLNRFKKDHLFFMAEDNGLCTYEKHHKLKILLFLSSMRSFFENLKKNNIDNVELIKDDKVPKNKKFDLIISNINRNVILKSFEAFIETEAKEFILSGFLETDFEILLRKIKDLKFHLINKKNKNGWLMLRIKK